jgi:hypothetical protein
MGQADMGPQAEVRAYLSPPGGVKGRHEAIVQSTHGCGQGGVCLDQIAI